ncbi:MAG: branched-chain amino acid transaminase [Desulfovibrio sp.]|uniref:branched-chain amino acid transaminase n=1 Tax=Desulfovibrio sp. 7SRBS1 TaxID=3378064 RepID=UPI003B3F7488
MVQENAKIWFNGKLVPWGEANVHVLTHALHYGTAVFEGIRAYKCVDGRSAVFRLKEHAERLVESGKILGLPVPYSSEEIADAIIETLQANKLDAAYIRPLVFVGEGGMGVHPGKNPMHTCIAAWEWGAYLGEDALAKGIRIKTSTFTRHHVNIMMTKAKASGNYVNSVLAKMEAVADGYDEAMMLDPDGYVSEGSGENLFIVTKSGALKTAPLTSVLAGITRDSVMTMARDMGYEVLEQRFTRDELYTAPEAFFTGTAAELTPIRECDNRVIGKGKAGEVALNLQKEFFNVVTGANPKYSDWLHYYEV